MAAPKPLLAILQSRVKLSDASSGVLAFSHKDEASSKDEGGRLELHMTKLASLEIDLEGVGSGDISGEHFVWSDRPDSKSDQDCLSYPNERYQAA